jgi:hypothetical protein
MIFAWEFWPVRGGLRTNQTGNGPVLEVVGVIQLYGDGNLLNQWDALSGGWGNGAMWPGEYEITELERLDDVPQNEAYKGEGFPWRARLQEPSYILAGLRCTKCGKQTGRDGFFIHPDGNFPGSLGCDMPKKNDMDLFNKIASTLTIMKSQRLPMMYRHY